MILLSTLIMLLPLSMPLPLLSPQPFLLTDPVDFVGAGIKLQQMIYQVFGEKIKENREDDDHDDKNKEQAGEEDEEEAEEEGEKEAKTQGEEEAKEQAKASMDQSNVNKMDWAFVKAHLCFVYVYVYTIGDKKEKDGSEKANIEHIRNQGVKELAKLDDSQLAVVFNFQVQVQQINPKSLFYIPNIYLMVVTTFFGKSDVEC